jgi:hypothetical protein
MVRAYAIGGLDLARLRLNRTHFPNIKAALGIQINFGDAAIVKSNGKRALTIRDVQHKYVFVELVRRWTMRPARRDGLRPFSLLTRLDSWLGTAPAISAWSPGDLRGPRLLWMAARFPWRLRHVP